MHMVYVCICLIKSKIWTKNSAQLMQVKYLRETSQQEPQDELDHRAENLS